MNIQDRIRRRASALALCLLFGQLPLLTPGQVQAQNANTLLVNSTADQVDLDPGDGICDADRAAGATCTLRAAIMEANSLGGSQTIQLPRGEYRLTIAGIDDNLALSGDLDITSDMTIIGISGSRPTIDGNGLDRVFHVGGAVNRVRFQNLVVRGGATSDETSDDDRGGGIFAAVAGQVIILDSLITGNKSNSGGGVASSFGRLHILRSTIELNQAAGIGGGVEARNRVIVDSSSIAFNSARDGAGLAVDGDGSLSMSRSSIANNNATGTGRVLGGGGLLLFARGRASLENTTISSNSAIQGGGVSLLGDSLPERDLQLRNVTITRNSGGGIAADAASSIVAASSIIASNSGNDCRLSGITIAGSNNLTGDTTCALSGQSNLPNRNPLLGPLAFNGGSTRSHAPLSGSLAIDRGNTISCTSDDQRRVRRPQGAACDIGAVEVVPSTQLGTPTLLLPPMSITSDQTTTLTLTWTVPPTMTWTDLAIVDLQLTAGEEQPLLLRFSQGVSGTEEISESLELAPSQALSPTDTLTLFDASGPAGTAALGTDELLESATAALDLGASRLQSDGPQGQSVTLTLSIRFKPALAGKRYRATLAARDDAGNAQAPIDAGALALGPFAVFAPVTLR
jgi:CSLREA domain-containing protein